MLTVELDLTQLNVPLRASYHGMEMAFPIKKCSVCEEEFELRPDKPGFADRCPACSTPEETAPTTQRRMDALERKTSREANAARREAMRDLLYRKDR
jgi:hypothetical protein